ncbi:MAG: glycine cleavage system aminomethyltransferase GcvT [Acidobacteriota bacterium]|nr:glycine cleavage system aminomethyltransferase GcvT [Acidobacteriota bacterium]
MTTAVLKRSPLHDLHIARGARMAPFAGYDMPIQYAPGVLKEHLHTRAAAGLFDVSHMGQFILHPRSGKVEDLALALEKLVPADLFTLKCGRQRYTQFTTPDGGIQDDLMVASFPSWLFLVVNAARKEADMAHLAEQLRDVAEIEVLNDRALIALQGPRSEAVLASLSPGVSGMKFLDAGSHNVMGFDCFVSRSGYTGEDGFEISVASGAARALVEKLLDNSDVLPIGLGARDSLRLEAGLCLYGSDIDHTTSPVEAALGWSIPKSRRAGGIRAGGFPGADFILAQMREGVGRRLTGLRPEVRPIRGGAKIYADETSMEAIGTVTSGGFGPSVNGFVAMGYVPAGLSAPGTTLFGEVRDSRYPMTVAPLPFVPHAYKRI